MFKWFTRNPSPDTTKHALHTDIHSHLLPGIDDGVKSFGESINLIRKFQEMGYSKLITTPHVMSDAFRNTNEAILNKLAELREQLRNEGISITVDAAAEYYLDEVLFKRLESNDPLLTFGNRHLLFETNFMTEPLNLKEFIFLATTKGYKVVLAHPERYIYLQQDVHKMEDLINRGVLFQLNISSLTGHYSKPAQVAAHKLIDRGWVHLLGSDYHHEQHVQLVANAQRLKYFQKALTLPLLNNSL